MSFSTLSIAVSGLLTSQRAIEAAGNNIANVNTPGYSRQRVEFRQSPPIPGNVGIRSDGMRGTGVTIADVLRVRDAFVDAAYRAESADRAFWQGRATLLGRAEAVLGPLDAGAPGALGAFWAGWNELSLRPEDPAARQSVLHNGAMLAGGLNQAADELAGLRREGLAQLEQGVEEANRLAAGIAELHQRIADASVNGQSPNDLQDQRDVMVDRLVELTGATVRPGALGTVDVYVGSIAMVRGEQAERLVTGSPPGTVSWSEGEAATLGGKLHGLWGVVTEDLPALSAQLDTIALALRDAVNAVHRSGYGLDGATGRDFFVGTDAANLAVDPALTTDGIAASASGQRADGNNALAIAGLSTAPAVGGASVADALGAFAGRVGSLAAAAMQAGDAAETAVLAMERRRAEVSSVSLDEELADIVRLQHAYEAAARVVTVADEMLDRLVNHTGLVGR